MSVTEALALTLDNGERPNLRDLHLNLFTEIEARLPARIAASPSIRNRTADRAALVAACTCLVNIMPSSRE
eukprot:3470701-Rhodomonas_salina.1